MALEAYNTAATEARDKLALSGPLSFSKIKQIPLPSLAASPVGPVRRAGMAERRF